MQFELVGQPFAVSAWAYLGEGRQCNTEVSKANRSDSQSQPVRSRQPFLQRLRCHVPIVPRYAIPPSYPPICAPVPFTVCVSEMTQLHFHSILSDSSDDEGLPRYPPNDQFATNRSQIGAGLSRKSNSFNGASFQNNSNKGYNVQETGNRSWSLKQRLLSLCPSELSAPPLPSQLCNGVFVSVSQYWAIRGRLVDCVVLCWVFVLVDVAVVGFSWMPINVKSS